MNWVITSTNTIKANHDYSSLFIRIADEYRLEVDLLVGMAITRTGFNPEFCEYDDAFYKQFLGDRHLKRRMQGYMPPDEIINYKTEKKLRAFRFGIFGILGQDARLEGYQENNLAKLLSCEESLRFVAGKVRANLDLGVDTKKAIRVFNNPNGYLYSRSALEHAMNGNALNFIKY